MNSPDAYSLPWSLWRMTPATEPRRTRAAIHSEATAGSASCRSLIVKPGSRRENRSSTVAKYSLPSPVGISVRSPHYFTFGAGAEK